MKMLRTSFFAGIACAMLALVASAQAQSAHQQPQFFIVSASWSLGANAVSYPEYRSLGSLAIVVKDVSDQADTERAQVKEAQEMLRQGKRVKAREILAKLTPTDDLIAISGIYQSPYGAQVAAWNQRRAIPTRACVRGTSPEACTRSQELHHAFVTTIAQTEGRSATVQMLKARAMDAISRRDNWGTVSALSNLDLELYKQGMLARTVGFQAQSLLNLHI